MITAMAGVDETCFRSGFVAVVGSPNVGKSSLVNALVGEKLCIATPKAQTTRHRILGLVQGDDYQIALTDTPGILADPAYELQRGMMGAAKKAARDADCLLLVTDVFEKDTELVKEWAISASAGADIPLVIARNKVDLLDDEDKEEEGVCGVSALTGKNVDALARILADNLPISQPLFDRDALTDRPARFFAAEIVRENILKLYSKEIPYSSQVVVTRFSQEQKAYDIDATIFVDKPSQKKILVGAKGSKIKQLGIDSRKDMKLFFPQVPKVHLNLWVKVDPNWRTDQNKLRNFGYYNDY